MPRSLKTFFPHLEELLKFVVASHESIVGGGLPAGTVSANLVKKIT
ncbi:hypothetical protein [Halobacillus sp. H74]